MLELFHTLIVDLNNNPQEVLELGSCVFLHQKREKKTPCHSPPFGKHWLKGKGSVRRMSCEPFVDYLDSKSAKSGANLYLLISVASARSTMACFLGMMVKGHSASRCLFAPNSCLVLHKYLEKYPSPLIDGEKFCYSGKTLKKEICDFVADATDSAVYPLNFVPRCFVTCVVSCRNCLRSCTF